MASIFCPLFFFAPPQGAISIRYRFGMGRERELPGVKSIKTLMNSSLDIDELHTFTNPAINQRINGVWIIRRELLRNPLYII